MEDDNRKPAAVEAGTADNTQDSPTKEVKPVLKRGRQGKSSDKHLKWDEAAIDEHNELRGTRMNIDEPKTPYVYYDSGAESDDSRRMKSPGKEKATLSWDNLQNRLDSVAAVREQYPSSPSDHNVDTDSSDVEDATKKEMRRLEFQEHRKRHYNEFELVKKYRAQNQEDEQNGDGDDEGDNSRDNGKEGE
jgi:protein phosphatase inhibitor 2